MSNVCSVVYIFPIKEGKGLAYIKRTQDVVYMYHVIIITTHQLLSCAQKLILVGCCMIITCKPHGVNMIGTSETTPRKHSMYITSLKAGSRDKTMLETAHSSHLNHISNLSAS